MYGIVYKHTNKITGKSYIGCSTKSVFERLDSHKNRANLEKSYFQRSLKKYGKENFESIQIDTANSESEMFEKEKFWIKFYNTISPNGYNLTEGGEGITNMIPEIRAKISKTKTGKSVPKLKGRVRSQEERNKISKGLGGSKILAKNITTFDTIILETVQDGKNYGFNPSLISAVILGKRNHHKNFIFSKIIDANTEVSSESNKSETL
jgi:group I intron endonuclease